MGVAITQVQDLALGLLNLMSFSWAHCSSLSRSLWMASHPSGMLTARSSLVSTNFLKVHLIALLQMLKSTGPGTDPWGIPLLTDLHPAIDPPLYDLLTSFSYIQQSTCQIHFFPVLRRMLWGGWQCQKPYWNSDDISGSYLVHWCIYMITEGH